MPKNDSERDILSRAAGLAPDQLTRGDTSQLSDTASSPYIERAKEIGIDSFWHKEIQEQPLTEIMNRTMAEESVYPLTTPVIQFRKITSAGLTNCELEVLRELVTGASNKEIRLAIESRGGGLIINNGEI